jgi:hypothetical protein
MNQPEDLRMVNDVSSFNVRSAEDAPAEQMIVELKAAGWIAITAEVWRAPAGKFYGGGAAGAWKIMQGAPSGDPANALKPTTKQLHRIHELIAQAESLSYSLPMASEDRQEVPVVCLYEAAMGQLHMAVQLLRRANGETDTLGRPMEGEFAGQLAGNLDRAETSVQREDTDTPSSST